MGSDLHIQTIESESSCEGEDSKSMTEYDWIFHYLSDFIDSPIWRHPLQSFIDTNSIVFEGEAEMTNVQKNVYKAFTALIDELIVKYIHPTGITTKQFLMALDGEMTQQIIEFIMSCDDVTVFKKMMRCRNLELEREALKIIGQDPSSKTSSRRSSSTFRKCQLRRNTVFVKASEMVELAGNGSGKKTLREIDQGIIKRGQKVMLADSRLSEIFTGKEKDYAGVLGTWPGIPIPVSSSSDDSASEQLSTLPPIQIKEHKSPPTVDFTSCGMTLSSEEIQPLALNANEKPLPLRKTNISKYLKEITALSRLDDTFEPLPTQVIQNENPVDVKKRKEILLEQKHIVIRAKREDREKKVKEYNTSKLIMAIEFLCSTNNGSDSQFSDKSYNQIEARKKALVEILKGDLKL